MASHPVGKRLPISCEPCRKRKIRCPRDHRPCQTCIRRGLRPEECIFLGQSRLSLEHVSATESSIQRELLARIRNLEDLLHKQIDGQAPLQNPGDPVSPPITTAGSTKTFSESDRGTDVLSTESRNQPPGNVGSLQVSPSGHVRYVPLPSQWNSVLAETPANQDIEDLGSDLADEEDHDLLFSSRGAASRAELLALLPPGRYCDALKDVYFKVFSPLFHVLHDPTFEAEYQQFRRDADSMSMGWVALLFIILAIAVTALDDNDPTLSDLGRERTVSGNIKVLSSRYRSAAMRCLAADGIVSRHSLRALQALILLIYARSHRSLPTWTLLGFTHHVAIAMGCHIDPDRFGLGSVECEERRRAWAALVMMYTVQNTAFGSLDQRLLTQDVRLPADVDDASLIHGTHPDRRMGPTQMTYLLIKFRLYEISSKICQGIFSLPNKSLFTIPQLEKEIFTVQEICNTSYLRDTTREPLPDHHMANLNIIYSYIHQLCLLMHRPGFCRYLQGDNSDETRNSRKRCVDSARSVLSIYETLCKSPQFAPYIWYNSGLGSFHAFHGAIVLAVVLMKPDSQAEFNDIKAILQNSLDTFASLSHRSNICSKAVKILRHLIDVACSRNYRNPEPPETHLSPPGPGNSSAGFIPTGSPVTESQMETLFAQIQPQYWVTPSAIPWEGWDFLTEGQPLSFQQPVPV
ncbi:hypothetical protein VTN00DRAFT_2563 [Thermoascus crustaceus]|uniref:uncharacterized protein n=1 Tax=Thermoascus crustaceus TaxID=5088 RepID=UPI003743026B